MLRAALAVIVGYVIWSTLWLFGNVGVAVVWPEVADPEAAEIPRNALLSTLGLSFVCSLISGLVAGKIRRGRAVVVMAVLLLATGIAVQIEHWERLPLWYHLVFLAAIVPLCLVGARFTGKKA